MNAYRRRSQTPQIVKLITALFLSTVVVSCSRAPTALSEEELLKVLVQVNHVGPLNFRRDVWPTLKDKTITYCGQLQEAKTSEAQYSSAHEGRQAVRRRKPALVVRRQVVIS